METSGTTWTLRSRWWGTTTTTTTTITSLTTRIIMSSRSVLVWAAADEWGELENRSQYSLTWINYMKLSNFLHSNCFSIKLNWSNCRMKLTLTLAITDYWLLSDWKKTISVFSTDFFSWKDFASENRFEYCLKGSGRVSLVSLSFMSLDYLSQHFMINWGKWWKKREERERERISIFLNYLHWIILANSESKK